MKKEIVIGIIIGVIGIALISGCIEEKCKFSIDLEYPETITISHINEKFPAKVIVTNNGNDPIYVSRILMTPGDEKYYFWLREVTGKIGDNPFNYDVDVMIEPHETRELDIVLITTDTAYYDTLDKGGKDVGLFKLIVYAEEPGDQHPPSCSHEIVRSVTIYVPPR